MNTDVNLQWLIPTIALPDNWKRTQTAADREQQLTRAARKRQRHAERNLKMAKAKR